MVGFRNIAIHNYQTVNLESVQGIIEKNLAEIRATASFYQVNDD